MWPDGTGQAVKVRMDGERIGRDRSGCNGPDRTGAGRKGEAVGDRAGEGGPGA